MDAMNYQLRSHIRGSISCISETTLL